MRPEERWFGRFVPRGGPLERVSVGVKYLLLLALTVPALIVGDWRLNLIVIAVTAVVLLWSRVPWRAALVIPPMLLVTLAAVVAIQGWLGRWTIGALIVTTIVLALYATRLLTLTTPIPDLVDGIAAAARPLRWVRVDPDQVAIAVAVMLRSVPYLIVALGEVRQAARARGVTRQPLATVSSAAVRTVGYAMTTGEALAARGLAE